MIETTVDAFGELNVIFNNAGINRPRDFMEIDEANFQEIVRVNTWGGDPLHAGGRKQMIAQGSGGKIINTGSIASRQGYWDFVPYCGEVRHARGHPGDGTGADRAWDHRQRLRSRRRRHADVGRSQRGHPHDSRSGRGREPDVGLRDEHAHRPARIPEEVTPFLVYLASPESDYMTGQMYMVDGGQILV